MDLGTSEDCLANSAPETALIITATVLFRIMQKPHRITTGKVVRQRKHVFFKEAC